MKRNWFIICLLLVFLTGCASKAILPTTSPQVLNWIREKSDYRLVKADAIGESCGFKLFGIVTLQSPKYNTALRRLSAKVDAPEGSELVITNVRQKKSSLYLFLFSIPKLTVKADVVELL